VDWPHEPRAGLGWSFASLAAIASHLRLIPDVAPLLPPALTCMEALVATAASDVPSAANPAKQLAQRWYNGLPVTLAADALVPVAYRWCTQINENGKSWAVAGELSEFNHNAPVGYSIPATVVPHLRVTLLSHPGIHPRNALRIDLSAEQMRAAGLDLNIVDVQGDDVLQQMLWTVQLGDLASYYLGLLYEQDPSEVRALDWLKSHLAQSP
jgi:glucose/mannose-6-phosphate isomerase